MIRARPRLWRLVAADMTLLLALALLVVIVILIMYFADREESDEPLVDPQGTLIFEIGWPPACSADIDLWVRSPSGAIVGYSRKDSGEMNLLRDDLGHRNDPGGMNAETVLSRALTPGEWIANAHLYRANDCALPIKVDISVKRRSSEDGVAGTVRPLTDQSIELRVAQEERTLARLTLDGNGVLIPSSVSQRCVLIRKTNEEGRRC